MSSRRSRLIVFAAAVLVVFVSGAAIVLAAGNDAHRQRRPARRSQPGRPSAPRTVSLACPSLALGGQLPARVYLPAGYDSSARRYPVVYFLHGLPATRQSYEQNVFVAEAASAAEATIVVAPQGARNDGDDREYLDWSATENWPRAISHDLVSCIDERYRTEATRRRRMLVGLSAGGYGAFNIGLRNLATFGAVESWSGYFVATDPSGHHVLTLPTPAAQQAATVPSGSALANAMRRWPSLVAFYVGRADDRFADMNQRFDASLTHSSIRHVFRTYAGGHSPALWRREAPGWLKMGFEFLASGRVVAPPGR